MVIDFHAHYPRNQPEFPERLVQLLPAVGIDKICLCSAGAVVGEPNDVVLAAARRFPDRIIPLAYVDLGIDSPECVDAFVAQGFRGFKITNPRSPYCDEAYFPLYERMERSGMPLLAHTGPLMRFPQPKGMVVNSDWMRPICLDAVVRSFPKLNIVGAHMGICYNEEASCMARIHPNFFLDLTGAATGGWRRNKTPEFLKYHFWWEGAWDKVLFGTDILALDEVVPAKTFHDEMLAPLDLPTEVLAKVYGGNAARLLGM